VLYLIIQYLALAQGKPYIRGGPCFVTGLTPYVGPACRVWIEVRAVSHLTMVHALTRQVLTEIGLDLSELYVKRPDDFFPRVSIAYAIIVCDQAKDGCPRLFPFELQTLHWPFDDPTQAEGSTMERLPNCRTVLDQIERRIWAWLGSLEGI
jgi:hypothetical protein